MDRIFLFRVNPEKDRELYAFLTVINRGDLSSYVREAIKKQYLKRG